MELRHSGLHAQPGGARAALTGAQIVEIALGNPVNRRILERLPDCGLADAWLVSGGLFQTVWNSLTGRPWDHGIKDYDIFYFDDTDLSWEAEDAAIRRALSVLGKGAEIQVRNQARVHLWYPRKFGMPYAPLRDAAEGITRFLSPCCMIGMRPDGHGGIETHAPMGIDDLLSMTVRPNRTPNFNADNYRAKVVRWREAWPEITVIGP